MKIIELEPFYLEPNLASEAYFQTRGGSNWVEISQVREKIQRAFEVPNVDVVILEVRGSYRNPRPMDHYVPRDDHEYVREGSKGCYVAYRDVTVLDIIWEAFHGYELVGVENCVYIDGHAYLTILALKAGLPKFTTT